MFVVVTVNVISSSTHALLPVLAVIVAVGVIGMPISIVTVTGAETSNIPDMTQLTITRNWVVTVRLPVDIVGIG